MLGLINGAFYAMLSLGLAVIFGLLNIINFAHGALYMLGAFIAWFLLQYLGLGYWWALFLAPLATRLFGVIERTMLKRLYGLDHLYGLLLTFGLALIIQGYFRTSSAPRANPTPRRRRCREPQSRLHVPAALPGLGRRYLVRRLPRDLVRHRANQARLLPAGGNRKQGWCRRSASTCRG